MTTTPKSKKEIKWTEYLLQHLIVFLIAIVFPGVTTLVAPASWLTFERVGDNLSCTTRTCVYFVVPVKVQRVDHVTAIEHREREGQYNRVRKAGRDTNQTVYSDGEGWLVIQGTDNQKAEVSVSPASLEHAIEKATALLNSTTPGTTRMFVIANWKFGFFMGGVLTMLTAVCVFGYTAELIRRSLKLLRII